MTSCACVHLEAIWVVHFFVGESVQVCFVHSQRVLAARKWRHRNVRIVFVVEVVWIQVVEVGLACPGRGSFDAVEHILPRHSICRWQHDTW